MPRSKQAAKKNRTTKATVTALGTAGLGLSLVGSASASTTPAAEIPTSDTMGSEHRFVLDEMELADVSLATFHLFDKENIGSRVQQVQWGCRCGGCGWGWRGCRCGGCGGCGCCARWGRCRWC